MQPTKFDELWKAYCNDVEAHRQDWQTLQLFLPEFVKNLVTNLGWSASLVEIGSSGESFKPCQGSKKPISDLLVPVSKECWKFWMKLTLAKPNESPPFHPQPISLVVPFTVSLNNQVPQVTVETTLGSRQFKIGGSPEDYVSVSDFIDGAMHRRIRDGVSWDLQDPNGSRQIRL